LILQDTDIQNRVASQQLLIDYVADNIRNCGYTLRAGKVIEPESGDEELLDDTRGGNRRLVWEIGPGETLVVRTIEKVIMPQDLCATYAPLHRLSSKGLMLLNSSLVEPGYEGRLSCFLLNFSSQRITITRGMPITKMAFHRLTGPPGQLHSQVMQDEEYDAALSESAKRFHKSFMDVSGVEKRAVEKATGAAKSAVVWGGVIIAFLLLFSTLEPFFSNFIFERTGIYTDTWV
jgi:dCTP deaminase